MIRKKISLVSLLLVTSLSLLAQSNSYPTAGDVSIFNYSPLLVLQRNTDEGGFIQGVQTRFKNGTNNWYFGNLHSDSWIVSKGDYQNPKFTILQNGNVGIGTSSPSNDQGWNRVLDVSGTNHSKILATSNNSNFRVGIFSHNEEWHGGGGFIGTESNHTLFLIAGYDPKMTILTNGNIGIGTNNPNGKLEISGNSAVYSDFASYSGTTVNNILPNGKEPTLIISEKTTGTFPSIGNEITYRGGLSFGKGGPGIYSINPNPAGSSYYGELRFHTTYWNGTDYNNTDRMVIKLDGNVGIGTTNPTSKLTVAGNINSREVKVSVDAGADFVFEKDYALPSLQEVEKFVTENKHLPEIASAKEMQKEGINLSEMNIKLLQKIEELTLYVIEQNKRIELLEKKNK